MTEILETSESDSSEIITINQCQAAKHACSHTHMDVWSRKYLMEVWNMHI
jgi:hypothetical protein